MYDLIPDHDSQLDRGIQNDLDDRVAPEFGVDPGVEYAVEEDQESVNEEKNLGVPSSESKATSESILRLVPENQARWEADLDALGFAEGFRDRLSRCVNNLDEFFGLTPREALQQGWYDYATDDEGELGE